LLNRAAMSESKECSDFLPVVRRAVGEEIDQSLQEF